MRDYDPTTGRYLQADPLGLVDGASVYGYALQNPGRYVDPTGEFVPAVAALGGAVASALLQMGTNYIIGNMSALQAAKCINVVTVINAAAVGYTGFAPRLLAKSGLRTGAIAVAGASSQVNKSFPDLYINDFFESGDCEEDPCDVTLPPWAEALRDTIL